MTNATLDPKITLFYKLVLACIFLLIAVVIKRWSNEQVTDHWFSSLAVGGILVIIGLLLLCAAVFLSLIITCSRDGEHRGSLVFAYIALLGVALIVIVISLIIYSAESCVNWNYVMCVMAAFIVGEVLFFSVLPFCGVAWRIQSADGFFLSLQ